MSRSAQSGFEREITFFQVSNAKRSPLVEQHVYQHIPSSLDEIVKHDSAKQARMADNGGSRYTSNGEKPNVHKSKQC